MKLYKYLNIRFLSNAIIRYKVLINNDNKISPKNKMHLSSTQRNIVISITKH